MSESDFIKKNKPKIVSIDHEDGMIHVPGKGPMPLVGDLRTGKEYERLKAAEVEKREMNKRLIAVMSKTWVCTQCGERQSGRYIRVAHRSMYTGGQLTEVLVCRHRTCDAPVIEASGPPDPPKIMVG